jgi:hypothetical protein
MSKLVGDRMPEQVMSALDGASLEDKVGNAYLLVTGDPDGAPRPCMLSAGELLALDSRRLRVALWSGTHTGENLARGGPSLFCFITAGTVLYLRGEARALSGDARNGVEGFEIEVTSVESDAHPGLPVSGGLTFGVEGIDPVELVDRWRSRLATLRGL